MPDTGAPWNIPYVESTDLVSDWPADSLALANAIDSGLDAAGGLVAVKHALFTGTQTNSTGAGADFAITDLSITHEVADASNNLVIMGVIGVAGSTNERGGVGIGIAVDGTLVNVGTAAGNRTSVSSQTRFRAGGTHNESVTSPALSYVYTPGAGSKTYTLRGINVDSGTETVYINRNQLDTDGGQHPRGVSSLVIMEVKV